MESTKYSPETIVRAKKLREESGLTYVEISKRIGVPETTIRTWANSQEWKQPPLIEAEIISDPTDPKVQEIEELERKLQAAKSDYSKLGTLHKALQQKYDELEETVGLADEIGLPTIEPIKKKEPKGSTEATVVLVASDWHLEEEVKPEHVNMLNEYNLEIAQARATKFFQSGLRLAEIIGRDVKITTMLLPLLGDFISGEIHEELREVAQVTPMEAMETAQNLIASGINFILNNSKYNIILPCHVGNHTRTTKKVFVTTEYGHSLEYFMYKNLAMLFAGNKRVQFEVSRAYHSYQQVYGVTLRFHHGHGIRYYGGIGGLYIPVNKSIAQWNKAKHADLDVLGHFHQQKDGGNFISNGSLIGYNPYGIRIKADYEPPRQAFFVIDSKRGKTFTCPVVVE
jgi:transcriptional regulator with XRE-family HTH domain